LDLEKGQENKGKKRGVRHLQKKISHSTRLHLVQKQYRINEKTKRRSRKKGVSKKSRNLMWMEEESSALAGEVSFKGGKRKRIKSVGKWGQEPYP